MNSTEIPQGLAMALAQNLPAMSYFAALPTARQQAIIDDTSRIASHQEMQAFVDSLTHAM